VAEVMQMNELKNQILGAIESRARREAKRLAGEFARAASGEGGHPRRPGIRALAGDELPRCSFLRREGRWSESESASDLWTYHLDPDF
jgi:hypothetical protein